MSYGIIVAEFWTKGSGRRMRTNKDARILASYLFSAPHSNMLGLYYLAPPTACHETGLTPAEFEAAMAWLSTEDVAHYDPDAELVWVPNMAAHRLGDRLKPEDKRVQGMKRELERFRAHPFAAAFVRRYGEAFTLGEAFTAAIEAGSRGLRWGSAAPVVPLTSPFEGPAEGHPAAAGAPSEPPPPPAEAPPKPRSGSGSGSEPERETRAPAPVTGFDLQTWFGLERAAALGGLPWTRPPNTDGKASTFADRLNASGQVSFARKTMARMFQNIKERRPDWTDERLSKSPAFAFGTWLARFSDLLEELQHQQPEVAAGRSKLPPVYTGAEPR